MVMSKNKKQDKIVKYYNYTQPFYRIFYHGKSYGLHYGFWDENTKGLPEAILNTNKFLAQMAKIKKDDKILDAGCGVGGSAIWIAKNIGAQVTGITLSPRQLKKARELAREYGLEESLSFKVMDYTETAFEDSSFDVVWALESVCHAEDKKKFLREAHRLLKPGGRLIVSDGFLTRLPNAKSEQDKLQALLDGWVLPNLSSLESFERDLKELGFNNIKILDKTDRIMPTARKIRNKVRWGYPLAVALWKLNLVPELIVKNNYAGLLQYDLFQGGLMSYNVFYAEK